MTDETVSVGARFERNDHSIITVLEVHELYVVTLTASGRRNIVDKKNLLNPRRYRRIG